MISEQNAAYGAGFRSSLLANLASWRGEIIKETIVTGLLGSGPMMLVGLGLYKLGFFTGRLARGVYPLVRLNSNEPFMDDPAANCVHCRIGCRHGFRALHQVRGRGDRRNIWLPTRPQHFHIVTGMGLLKDFKTFISRGNVVDLAVGVVIGAAFGKIVSSLVADIIMPPIGLLVGNVNFTDLKLNLSRFSASGKPPVTINYGNFLQVTFDFLIVAAAIFVVVQAISRLKRKEAAMPEEPKPMSVEEKLLSEIRDLLRESTRATTGTEGNSVVMEKAT